MFKNVVISNTVVVSSMGEALKTVIPIILLVFVISFFIVPVPIGAMLAFALGSFMLVVGMGLFSVGVNISMSPIGEHVGSAVTGTRKLWLILLVSFLVGAIVTCAEPDLQVLANQMPAIPNAVMISAVALGVGIFLMFAMARIILGLNLQTIFVAAYLLVIVLAFVVPENFVAAAFDSGGVTTGPITVPFIMALGVGVARTRSDSSAGNDSFGLVAISSIGPILAVLVLSLVFHEAEGVYVPVKVPEMMDSMDMWAVVAAMMPRYFKEIAVSILPIALFFLAFQIFRLHLSRTEMIQIAIGIIYTYIGLVIFMTGVNFGFLPVGNYMGQLIGNLSWNWIIVPIGMLMGYFIVMAEPAVQVLNKQVADITAGTISQKAMCASLSIGVAISVGLSMLRILTGIPLLWFVVPGYIIAIALTFVVPPIFTAIAFDSGGVASGAMTATFLLPLAMGLCNAVGGDIVKDAFGVVAMVAMTPLITIQLLGLIYMRSASEAENEEMLL
ncbi:MAG: DUF1538 domain-containing protein [Synergistes sp.]|nr:DUF1538 domain-containing protein [Synergistes sp.]